MGIQTALAKGFTCAVVAASISGCSGVRVRSLADGRGLNSTPPYSPFGKSPQELCVEMHPKFLNVALEDSSVQKLCTAAGYEDPAVPLRCFEKAALIAGQPLSLKHRIDLCSGVELDDDPPLACFENAESVLGTRVSTDEKVRLCGGSPSDTFALKRDALSRF